MSLTRASIYVRQSTRQDEGIDRQLERCRALLVVRGWTLITEYKDNDVSASRHRGEGTGWASMLSDHAAGKFDVLVSINMDRLLRRIPDLAVLVERHVRVVTVEGDLDLSTESGELIATMLVAAARFEIGRKGSRMAAASEKRRAEGHPRPGRVPFGYSWVTATEREQRAIAGVANADYRWDVDPIEADHLRWAMSEALAGERVNVFEIAAGLEARGARTRPTRRHPSGGPLGTSTVRRLLLSPFAAGLLPPSQGPDSGVYLPERVAPADCIIGRWTPIVTEDEWLAVRARLLDPSRRTNAGGTARKWPLGGLASCATCMAPMRSAVDRLGHRAYRCPNGHILRRAIPIDTMVISAALDRLQVSDLSDLLVEPAADAVPSLGALRARQEALEARIREVVRLTARGGLAAQEAEQQLDELESERAEVVATMSTRANNEPLAAFLTGKDPADVWVALPLSRQREVLSALFSEIVIRPLGPGRRLTQMSESQLYGSIKLTWVGSGQSVTGRRLDDESVPREMAGPERDRVARALG